MTNVTQPPTAAVPAELASARLKLGTLHDILAVLRSGRMPPDEWPKAKASLELLDGLISEAQAECDALTPKEPPAEVDDSPVIPDKAPPPDAGLAAALAARELRVAG